MTPNEPSLSAVPHSPSTGERLQLLLQKALRQLDAGEVPDRQACANYIAQALRIHRDAMSSRKAVVPSGLAAWQIRTVRDMALSNLEAQLAITDLAEACRLSRGYFTRAFKTTFGQSPHRWRHQQRIAHACMLLRSMSTAIAEVAVMCGFNDQAHFTRAFKIAMGTTPHAYRIATDVNLGQGVWHGAGNSDSRRTRHGTLHGGAVR
jgi:AraC family transcriptional regulator